MSIQTRGSAPNAGTILRVPNGPRAGPMAPGRRTTEPLPQADVHTVHTTSGGPMAALNRVKVPTDQSTGPIGQTGPMCLQRLGLMCARPATAPVHFTMRVKHIGELQEPTHGMSLLTQCIGALCQTLCLSSTQRSVPGPLNIIVLMLPGTHPRILHRTRRVITTTLLGHICTLWSSYHPTCSVQAAIVTGTWLNQRSMWTT